MLLTILMGLDRSRFEPHLVTSNPALAAECRARHITTHEARLPEMMVEPPQVQLPILKWAKDLLHLRRLIRDWKIDAIYCNGGSSCQIGYYAGKLAKLPVISHLHSPYNRRYLVLYRCNRASRVIFVSQAIRDQALAKEKFLGRCAVLHNGIDAERFRPPIRRDASWRDRLSIPLDSVVFGQVSSLISRKGIDVLLRAFANVLGRNSRARLVLVGDGDQRDEFMSLAEELRIDGKVVWTGNQNNPLPYYQHVFDVNVLASRSDAFPLSVLEASSCALPNLASNVDGIPESVRDGLTGMLFEPGDDATLADKMIVLANSPAERERLGHAGREMIRASFSLDNFCRAVESALSEEVSAFNNFGSRYKYAY